MMTARPTGSFGLVADPLIFETIDQGLGDRLRRDRHWVSDVGTHYVVTEVRLMADTPGRNAQMWSVRGHPERDNEVCPIPER